MGMRHGSLFSGIGGFDLASEWMGWENIFHCEWNEFGQRVLKHYWPQAISYHDITKTDFSVHRGQIDILTGGFPCQPYSLAGKRKGTADSRHLWPEMLRAISEIQPTWVVGENVSGLVSWNGGVVFDEVQADVEAEGYEVIPFILPACAVNAPHRRDRVWFIAYCDSDGCEWCNCEHEKHTCEGRKYALNDFEQIDVENTDLSRCLYRKPEKGESEKRGFGNTCSGVNERVCRKTGLTTDTTGNGQQRWCNCGKLRNEGPQRKQRPKNMGSIPGTDWQDFPTESPVCTGNDGISDRLDGITFSKWRNESIKAAGNAIVPQVALQIFKAINDYDNYTS